MGSTDPTGRGRAKRLARRGWILFWVGLVILVVVLVFSTTAAAPPDGSGTGGAGDVALIIGACTGLVTALAGLITAITGMIKVLRRPAPNAAGGEPAAP